MNKIIHLPTFTFPGYLYKPDVIQLPDRVTDIDYESFSKWLIGGLTEKELRAQAGPVLNNSVVYTRIDAQNYYGGILKIKFSDDFALKTYDWLGKTGFKEVVVQGDDWYGLSIIKSGSYQGRSGDNDFYYGAGSCVMIRYDKDEYHSECPVLNEPGSEVEILFRPHILTKKLGISKYALEKLLYPDNPLTPSRYHSRCLVTPQIAMIVNELNSCTMDVMTFKMYAESKALELLSCYLQALKEQRENTLRQNVVSRHSLRQLNHAKTLLTQNLNNPPSLEALCRDVGLSRSSLTRGFKSQFGETVYDFVLRHRMEKARQLLRDRRLTIDLVAGLVGYSDTGSFRKIFRRYFGVLPSEYKTGRRASRAC